MIKKWIQNRSLAVKLWGMFAILSMLLIGLLAVLLPGMLKSFFTNQMYDILISSQSSIRTGGIYYPDADSPGNQEPVKGSGGGNQEYPQRPGRQMEGGVNPSSFPLVHHFVLGEGTGEMGTVPDGAEGVPPDEFLSAIKENAAAQSEALGTYAEFIDGQSMYYIIRKTSGASQGDIVSFLWGNYRDDLVTSMFGKFMLLGVIVMMFSWIPCYVMVRYLVRPLKRMERHVGRIAARDWHEPLMNDRRDEIGSLATAIESMRQQLARQDKAQQFYLQNISHELKTPIMVIRGYVQSINDGLYPKGTLGGSLAVVMKETDRLERRVRDLLMLNKWNYESSRDRPGQVMEAKPLIVDVMERLKHRRPDVGWELDIDVRAAFYGNPEQWQVAFENILDNQLRYATSRIWISVQSGREATSDDDGNVHVQPFIRIANDGPSLDAEMIKHAFDPFQIGEDGQFGLGLAIVRQIADVNGMRVWAANEQEGVAFYIEPGK